MNEVKQYLSLTFEASDDLQNPLITPNPFGAVVAFCREDAVSELYRQRQVSAELLAALETISSYPVQSRPPGAPCSSIEWTERQCEQLIKIARAAIAKAEGKL